MGSNCALLVDYWWTIGGLLAAIGGLLVDCALLVDGWGQRWRTLCDRHVTTATAHRDAGVEGAVACRVHEPLGAAAVFITQPGLQSMQPRVHTTATAVWSMRTFAAACCPHSSVPHSCVRADHFVTMA